MIATRNLLRQLCDTVARLWRADSVFGFFRKADASRGRAVLAATCLLTLASFAGMGWFSYQNLMATREASHWEKHTYLVILELDNLLSAVKDAESGQRGFVITGNRSYLAPYDQALVAIDSHLATLRALIRNNPEQQQRLADLLPVLRTKLALLDANIKTRSTHGFQSARDQVMTDAGRQAMETLRAKINAAVHEEKHLLRERTQLERMYSNRNFSFLLAVNLFGGFILATLYLFLWREFSRRIINEKDLLTSRDQLEAHNRELRQVSQERQEMEAQLGRYSDLYDFAPVGYFNLDRGGVIRAVNATGARFLGNQRASLLGRNLDRFLTDETRPSFHGFLARVFAGEPARASCEVAFDRQEAAPVFVQVEAVASQSRDDCRAVIVDISELKRAEAEQMRLEDQLHQSQKMESVGRLAGGVAHDFNNMLSVILGQANLALMDLEAGSPLHTTLEEIRKAAERSADLTRQLLAFARRQTVAPKVLDLNRTIDGMLTMLQRILGENVRLIWHPAAGLWPVKVDPSQVDQILANLCSNSRDSIAEVGSITIETRNAGIDEEYCSLNAGFVPGEYVQLVVSDNGCGMDREVRSHIFEPFFTTKGAGKGTGLGLATVFGAVKQNNGFINVYSEPKIGTSFTIYLPRHREAVEQPSAETAAPTPLRGLETILVVEDEPAVLTIATTILERQGYRVLAANSPGEALRLAEEHGEEIALLMTDVVMPEMSGRDLANTLIERHPRLKLLFMSGYTSDIIAHHGVIDEGVHFIQKPFTTADLADKVRAVLDAR